MNSKVVVGLIVSMVVIYGLTTWIIKERELNSLINPEVYPAFRKIENYCLGYVEQSTVNKQIYEQCKTLVAWMEEDSKKSNEYPDYSVSVEEYYNFLTGIGFNLPPFRLKEPPTDVQKNQAMMEQKLLMEQQHRIIENQINKGLKEIDAMIKSSEKD